MRNLLSGVKGVQAVDIKEDKPSHVNNSVAVTFDKTATDQAKITAKVREVWDIAWFECPSPCGNTSATAGNC